MIEYSTEMKVVVRIDGKKSGEIVPVEGGFRYFPTGSKRGGEVYPSIEEVKASLED